MAGKVNYRDIFNEYLQYITSARNPKAESPEVGDLGWDKVLNSVMFDFGGKGFSKNTNMVSFAKNVSLNCIHKILFCMQQELGVLFNSISCDELKAIYPNVRFVLQNISSKDIYIFAETEKNSFWKSKNVEPEPVQKYMVDKSAKHCKYVYFMYDYAYLQVIGHNDDERDPGRGYNLYSFKWFFETFYGEDEYQAFLEALNEYIDNVNDRLGYIQLKSLTSNTILNFRKITERHIIKFPYEKILDSLVKQYEMPEEDYDKIYDQFIHEKTYRIALGESNFSESLLTAEWLYDSMKLAKAIDLTVIGMGYFKAVEQLLYQLIKLHVNEKRKIRKDVALKNLPSYINLNDEAIQNKWIDTTIGSMAIFYKNNLNMLRTEISWRAKKYIREKIFEYKDLRNGYIHKDNIHSWEKIDLIRKETFLLIFLLLGAHELSENDLMKLGLDNDNEYSDYMKLCEYVNFHAGNVFFFDLGEQKDSCAFGASDLNITIVKDRYIHYSGLYFKQMGKDGETIKFTENNLPDNIYIGKMVFAQTEMVNMDMVKVTKIYEHGTFTGPSIVDEVAFDY